MKIIKILEICALLGLFIICVILWTDVEICHARIDILERAVKKLDTDVMDNRCWIFDIKPELNPWRPVGGGDSCYTRDVPDDEFIAKAIKFYEAARARAETK